MNINFVTSYPLQSGGGGADYTVPVSAGRLQSGAVLLAGTDAGRSSPLP